jgi:nucleoside-diphosphate-sugar epimerase
MILVTGSSGLIGRHLCTRLVEAGLEHRLFDIRRSKGEDIRDAHALEAALKGITGIVHLAAISRVVWGERDLETCRATNVGALKSLGDLAVGGAKPWVIFASSREVYGAVTELPVREDSPLVPINVYGRSKRDGEAIVEALWDEGLVANICRFSNVFGCPKDHRDRVAMAFASVAAHGGTMSIEGSRNTFDFTSVEDTVDGLFKLVDATRQGERLSPIHFTSGRGTSLGELAEIAASRALAKVEMVEAPQRMFDVTTFVGDPSRAKALLGWRAKADLNARIGRLVADLAAASLESPTAAR